MNFYDKADCPVDKLRSVTTSVSFFDRELCFYVPPVTQSEFSRNPHKVNQQTGKIPPVGNRRSRNEAQSVLQRSANRVVSSGNSVNDRDSYVSYSQEHQVASNNSREWVEWCGGCTRRQEVGVASSGTLARSASGPGAAVVGCLVGVYPCSSTGPRGPTSHLLQAPIPSHQQNQGCRACCCVHSNHQPPAVQLTSQRAGLSLRVARVASTTSVRAAPYAHPQHQGLGQECR